MGKILAFLLVILLFVLLFFPRWIPGLLRKLGRSLRDVGKAGRELATGEEEPGSPLARYEVQAGKIVQKRILATTRFSQEASLQDEVARVGGQVAQGASRREIPYRFHLIEDREPNGFAIPGGTVLVTRGLLDLCGGDPSSLACVLGHEIAHVDRRHALLNLAAKAAATTGASLLRLGRLAILRHMAQGIEELLISGYRQDQEFDADRAGAELAARAGFDPRGFSRVLRRLEERDPDSGNPLGQVFRYFRSHPPVRERVARLERRYGGA